LYSFRGSINNHITANVYNDPLESHHLSATHSYHINSCIKKKTKLKGIVTSLCMVEHYI